MGELGATIAVVSKGMRLGGYKQGLRQLVKRSKDRLTVFTEQLNVRKQDRIHDDIVYTYTHPSLM